jgi:hypothetical protein
VLLGVSHATVALRASFLIGVLKRSLVTDSTCRRVEKRRAFTFGACFHKAFASSLDSFRGMI